MREKRKHHLESDNWHQQDYKYPVEGTWKHLLHGHQRFSTEFRIRSRISSRDCWFGFIHWGVLIFSLLFLLWFLCVRYFFSPLVCLLCIWYFLICLLCTVIKNILFFYRFLLGLSLSQLDFVLEISDRKCDIGGIVPPRFDEKERYR